MKRTGREDTSGQALVEFALTALIFLMMTMGTVDIGRAVWNYNTLAEAVRAGTRYAVVNGYNSPAPTGPQGSCCYSAGPPSSDTQITRVVKSAAVGMDPTKVTVYASWPDSSNFIGSNIVVTATYTFQPLATIAWSQPITLTAASSRSIQN